MQTALDYSSQLVLVYLYHQQCLCAVWYMIISRTTEEALIQYLSIKYMEVYMGKKLDREISEAATLVLVETLERIREQEHLTNKGVMDYLDSKGTTYLLKV